MAELQAPTEPDYDAIAKRISKIRGRVKKLDQEYDPYAVERLASEAYNKEAEQYNTKVDDYNKAKQQQESMKALSSMSGVERYQAGDPRIRLQEAYENQWFWEDTGKRVNGQKVWKVVDYRYKGGKYPTAKAAQIGAQFIGEPSGIIGKKATATFTGTRFSGQPYTTEDVSNIDISKLQEQGLPQQDWGYISAVSSAGKGARRAEIVAREYGIDPEKVYQGTAISKDPSILARQKLIESGRAIQPTIQKQKSSGISKLNMSSVVSYNPFLGEIRGSSGELIKTTPVDPLFGKKRTAEGYLGLSSTEIRDVVDSLQAQKFSPEVIEAALRKSKPGETFQAAAERFESESMITQTKTEPVQLMAAPPSGSLQFKSALEPYDEQYTQLSPEQLREYGLSSPITEKQLLATMMIPGVKEGIELKQRSRFDSKYAKVVEKYDQLMEQASQEAEKQATRAVYKEANKFRNLPEDERIEKLNEMFDKYYQNELKITTNKILKDYENEPLIKKIKKDRENYEANKELIDRINERSKRLTEIGKELNEYYKEDYGLKARKDEVIASITGLGAKIPLIKKYVSKKEIPVTELKTEYETEKSLFDKDLTKYSMVIPPKLELFKTTQDIFVKKEQTKIKRLFDTSTYTAAKEPIKKDKIGVVDVLAFGTAFAKTQGRMGLDEYKISPLRITDWKQYKETYPDIVKTAKDAPLYAASFYTAGLASAPLALTSTSILLGSTEAGKAATREHSKGVVFSARDISYEVAKKFKLSNKREKDLEAGIISGYNIVGLLNPATRAMSIGALNIEEIKKQPLKTGAIVGASMLFTGGTSQLKSIGYGKTLKSLALGKSVPKTLTKLNIGKIGLRTAETGLLTSYSISSYGRIYASQDKAETFRELQREIGAFEIGSTIAGINIPIKKNLNINPFAKASQQATAKRMLLETELAEYGIGRTWTTMYKPSQTIEQFAKQKGFIESPTGINERVLEFVGVKPKTITKEGMFTIQAKLLKGEIQLSPASKIRQIVQSSAYDKPLAESLKKWEGKYYIHGSKQSRLLSKGRITRSSDYDIIFTGSKKDFPKFQKEVLKAVGTDKSKLLKTVKLGEQIKVKYITDKDVINIQKSKELELKFKKNYEADVKALKSSYQEVIKEIKAEKIPIKQKQKRLSEAQNLFTSQQRNLKSYYEPLINKKNYFVEYKGMTYLRPELWMPDKYAIFAKNKGLIYGDKGLITAKDSGKFFKAEKDIRAFQKSKIQPTEKGYKMLQEDLITFNKLYESTDSKLFKDFTPKYKLQASDIKTFEKQPDLLDVFVSTTVKKKGIIGGSGIRPSYFSEGTRKFSQVKQASDLDVYAKSPEWYSDIVENKLFNLGFKKIKPTEKITTTKQYKISGSDTGMEFSFKEGKVQVHGLSQVRDNIFSVAGIKETSLYKKSPEGFYVPKYEYQLRRELFGTFGDTRASKDLTKFITGQRAYNIEKMYDLSLKGDLLIGKVKVAPKARQRLKEFNILANSQKKTITRKITDNLFERNELGQELLGTMARIKGVTGKKISFESKINIKEITKPKTPKKSLKQKKYDLFSNVISGILHGYKTKSKYPKLKGYNLKYPKADTYNIYPDITKYETYGKYDKYPSYPTYPSYPDYPSYPKYNKYPEYPEYPSYPKYPKYPEYNKYPSYPTYPNYPKYPNYPTVPSFPDLFPRNAGKPFPQPNLLGKGLKVYKTLDLLETPEDKNLGGRARKRKPIDLRGIF